MTQEEKNFMDYWEKNRLKQKKIFRQFLLGIPAALLFVIPIAVNFFSGWSKRADMEANNGEFNPLVLMVALLLIAGFVAIFSRRFQWDRNEQRYRELEAKRSAENPAEEKK